MYKIFIATICIALLAQPIAASAASPISAKEDHVPVVIDALFIRPPGFVAMVAGFGIFAIGVAVPPFVLAWRPTDMHKTFKSLVINPFRFTFVDPLGHHPDRVASNSNGEIN